MAKAPACMQQSGVVENPDEDVATRSVEPVREGGRPNAVRCPNCGSDHVERYCARCGQRAGDLHVPVSAFFREALNDVLSFDSKVWSTVFALLRHPGHLTVEHWRGRRARYVAPLRLYLFVSFVSFLFLTVFAPDSFFDATGDNPDAAMQIFLTGDERASLDDLGADDPAPVRWVLQRGLRPVIEAPERAETFFVQRLPWVFFFLVPVFAAMLRLLYRRRERFFVPHLVFALHFFTTGFMLYVAGAAINALSATLLGSAISLPALVVLLFVSLRRVYRERAAKTLAKLACLVAAHGFAVMTALFLLLIVTGLSA